MKKYFSRPGFWARFGSFMLCVLMLSCLMTTILLADIRIVTEKENMSAIIKQSLFSPQTISRPGLPGNGHGAVVARPQPRLAIPKLEEAAPANGLTDALVEMIYNMIAEQAGEEIDFTLEDAKAFVEESTLDDFISDTSAALVNDLLTGENTLDLSDETITELLTENAPLIEEHFNVVMDEQTIVAITETVTQNEVLQQIRDKGVTEFIKDNGQLMEDMGLGALTGGMGGGMNEAVPSPDGMGGAANGSSFNIMDILNTARSFTSLPMLIGCAVAVLVLIGLLCLANCKHIWYAIRGTGRTFVFSTLLVSIVTVVVMTAPAMWAQVFSFQPMIGKVAGLVLEMTAPVHLGICGLGIALALVGTILKFVAKGKARRLYQAELAAQAAQAEPVIIEEEPVLVIEETEDGSVLQILVEEPAQPE
jgi:hypothetical protein